MAAGNGRLIPAGEGRDDHVHAARRARPARDRGERGRRRRAHHGLSRRCQLPGRSQRISVRSCRCPADGRSCSSTSARVGIDAGRVRRLRPERQQPGRHRPAIPATTMQPDVRPTWRTRSACAASSTTTGSRRSATTASFRTRGTARTAPAGPCRPTTTLRFQTELEFGTILGTPYLGTGSDPTSANNRNIEPWTIAGEKWDGAERDQRQPVGHPACTPHNHDPAYNFLQDGPMVTVTVRTA